MFRWATIEAPKVDSIPQIEDHKEKNNNEQTCNDQIFSQVILHTNVINHAQLWLEMCERLD